MPLPAVSVALQATVAILFLGSLVVAARNLRVFRHNHQAGLLRSVMSDYQKLVRDNTFQRYPEELEHWRGHMGRSNLAPAMAYYTELGAISQVGFFYDYLGLLVQQGLLDFRLCFEVIPMPYNFWAETADFRQEMRRVTYPHFWDAFEYLEQRYEAERRRRGIPVVGFSDVAAHAAAPAGRAVPRLALNRRLSRG